MEQWRSYLSECVTYLLPGVELSLESLKDQPYCMAVGKGY
jgi:hypothetical protein